jgi:hypothetical protein
VDADRFEKLLRSLAPLLSRRGALRLLAGSAFGSLLTVGALPTEAKKKKKRKKKSPAAIVPPPPPPITCAQICDGCCKAGGRCASGTTGAACGTGGEPCATCTWDQVCSNGDCKVLPCGAGGVCRVFVTSTEHTGNLGGLSGADTICRQRAQAAGLPGTYKAWLSDGTDSPITRFLTMSPGPYRLVDGTHVVDGYEDLADGSLDAPINRTETGALVGEDIHTWTNTRANGTDIRSEHGGDHCANWTPFADGAQGVTGVANATDSTWTFADPYPCTSGLRLYCFQAS